MKKIFIWLLGLIMFSSYAQDGGLDTAFNPSNYPPSDVMGTIDSDNNLYIGKPIAVGSSNEVLKKFDPSGNEMTFPGSTSVYDGQISKILILSSGEKLVAGNFTGRLRKLSTGMGSPNFNAQIPLGFLINDMVEQNGKILLAGGTCCGLTPNTLIRLNSDGSTDLTFTQGVTGSDTNIMSIVVIPGTNEIIAAGKFSQYNSVNRNSIVRLSQNGDIISSAFNPQLMSIPNNYLPMVNSIALQSDGNLLIAGKFSLGSKQYLARINATTGVVDSNFTVSISSLMPNTAEVMKVAIQCTGNIIIGGIFNTVNGTSRNHIARVLPTNGALDTTFNPGTGLGTESYGGVNDLTLDNTGDVYILGDFTNYNGVPKTNFARVNGSSALIANNDSNNTITTAGGNLPVNVLSNDTYGNLPITLQHITLSQVSASHPNISISATTGVVNVTPGIPAGNYSLVYKICRGTGTCNCSQATVNITVIPSIIANNDNFSAVCINGLSGGTSGDVTSNDTMDGQPLNDSSVSITLINNGGINNATIDNNGVITIPAGTYEGLYTLTYQICQLNSSNCKTANVLICVTGTGTDNMVNDIKVQANGYIVIGGYFTAYNGITRNRIARLKPDLSLDETFDPQGIGFDGPVNTIFLQGSKILVGGNFDSTTSGVPVQDFARLNSDGTLDNTFTPLTFLKNGSTNPTIVNVIKIGPSDGKIYIGGSFSTVNSTSGTSSICRLNSSGTVDTSFISPYTINTTGAVRDIFHYNNSSNDMLIGSSGINIINNSSTRILSKINGAGTIYTNFLMPIGNAYQWVNTIVAQGNTATIGGMFTNYNNSGRNYIVQITSTGGVANNLFNQGAAINNHVSKIMYDANSRLIIGGGFSQYGSDNARGIVRVNNNGVIDNTFATGTGFDGIVLCLAHQANGEILVGGNFTQYNGNQANYFTRLDHATNPVIQTRMMMDGDSNKITIYPNPSEGIFTINFEGYGEQQFEMTIHNTLGQQIYKGAISPEIGGQIDLTNYQAGNYFIRLQSNTETINKIITKK